MDPLYLPITLGEPVSGYAPPYTLIQLSCSKKELCFHIHRIPQLPANFTNIFTPFWLAPGLISWSRGHGQAWVIECSNFEQAAHTEKVSGILSTATHSINYWNRSVNLKKDIEATVYTLNFQSNWIVSQQTVYWVSHSREGGHSTKPSINQSESVKLVVFVVGDTLSSHSVGSFLSWAKFAPQ